MAKVLGMTEDYKLWYLFMRTRDAMYRTRQKELQAIHISSREAAVLLIVVILGKKATIGRIARLAYREPNSLSAHTSRMEKDGLVKKVKLRDGRSIRVLLTDKGRRAFEYAMKHESTNEIMSVLHEDEKQQLNLILHKLRNRAFESLGTESELLWS